MAGPGRAVPDGTRSLTWRTKDIMKDRVVGSQWQLMWRFGSIGNWKWLWMLDMEVEVECGCGGCAARRRQRRTTGDDHSQCIRPT